MAVIVPIGVMTPHVVLVVGFFDDGKQLVILGVVNDVVTVEVLPALQDQSLAILFGPNKYEAISLVDLVYPSFEVGGALGTPECFLDVVQVDPARRAIGGCPFVIRGSGTTGMIAGMRSAAASCWAHGYGASGNSRCPDL